MSDNKYIDAVTRIHIKENDLLSADFLEQLVQAPDYDTCLQLLSEKGWGCGGQKDGQLVSENVKEIIKSERDRAWDLMREVLHEDIRKLDIFLIPIDYHNLKAAIKETRAEHAYEDIYMDQGAFPAEMVREAVQKKEFGALPERMAKVGEEALGVFLRTGDGQLCDVMIDKAAVEELVATADETDSDALKEYAELTAVSANIKTALRAMLTGKDQEFLEKALAECKTLNKTALIKTALVGIDEMVAYLSGTAYGDGSVEFDKSMAAFERWCDNLLIERMKIQKWNPFGIDPLVAYVLACENERKSVRVILSGKQNGLPEEAIRERIRETYA